MTKEESMKRLIAAMAILAVVFVMGCQDTKKVTELQGQVDKYMQQITELEGQVGTLTMERDSLQNVVTEMAAKVPAAKGGSTGGTKPPTAKGGLKPPTKK